MRERSREGRKRYKTNVVILTFGEIWVKNTKEFFVLSLQLFCKFEIMSPPPTNFLIVRVLQRGQTILPSCDQSLGLGTYEHEDTGKLLLGLQKQDSMQSVFFFFFFFDLCVGS